MDRLPIITESDEIQKLHAETTAIPGRPGWRRDVHGKEWYSAAWITEGTHVHVDEPKTGRGRRVRK